MAGSEFSDVRAMATAISMERDVEDTEDTVVTTTGAAEEDVVENKPADKLLKVERGCDILRKNTCAKLTYCSFYHPTT